MSDARRSTLPRRVTPSRAPSRRIPTCPILAALLPAVGAGAVCLVGSALLFAAGHPHSALFLALWKPITVGLVDNPVRPLLIKAGMHLNGAVVSCSLIGGLGALGAVGLLLGPLGVALFLES